MHALPVIAAGFLVGGTAAAFGARFDLAWILCVVILALAGWLSWTARKAPVRASRRSWPILFIGSLVAGQAVAVPAATTAPVSRGVYRLEATVERMRPGQTTRAYLRVESGESLDGAHVLPRGARVALAGLDEAPGARVRAIARLRPRTVFFNPAAAPPWPEARPTAAFGHLSGPARVVEQAPPEQRLLHSVRCFLRRRLNDTLEASIAGLARALLLGETSGLATEDRETVRDAGVAHVLAVSGLHVTMLAGLIVALTRWVTLRIPWLARRRDPRRFAHAVGVPAALAYAALVGDAPSAWRAAVTAGIAWSLVALGRRPRPIAVTAAAVIVLGCAQPADFGRPAFALSIVATVALIGGREAELPPVHLALRAGARTMIATAPIIAWLFGGVPVAGLLANLVAVPLAAIALLPLSAAHLCLASVLPSLCFLTRASTEALGRAFLATCDVFATVRLGLDLPPLDAVQLFALAVACFGTLALRSRRWRALALAGAVVLAGGEELRIRYVEQPRDVLRASFLDVGQGDAALFDLPDGRLMVVDAGGSPGGGPDPGAQVIAPLLAARRRSVIDILVLSHPHPDHYGGAAALLERFEVREVWTTGQASAEEPEGPLARMLSDSGVRIRTPPELCRGPRAFGRALIFVRAPCPDFDPGWGPNENSMVLELRLGDRRMLLTGDAEEHAEETLLERELGRADVLKVAHHGSRTSTSDALLARVRPTVAVVSAGRSNRFGHPHAEVWNRLSSSVRCPYRTDEHGAVTVWTDGDRLSARSLLGAPCPHTGAETGRGPRRRELY